MAKQTASALVAEYLDRLHEIHRNQRHTPELSYRAANENLLNAIGQRLDPPVTTTHELTDAGAGHPDFGFSETKSGNSRGVVEAKAPDDDVPETADGRQVSRYWKHYEIVLVTNYRDFLLLHEYVPHFLHNPCSSAIVLP